MNARAKSRTAAHSSVPHSPEVRFASLTSAPRGGAVEDAGVSIRAGAGGLAEREQQQGDGTGPSGHGRRRPAGRT